MSRPPRSALAVASLAVLAACLGGCASPPPYTYLPPDPLPALDAARVVDAPFERTWAALVEAGASSFFSVRGFEKGAGLLTLGFGEGHAPAFIDCGSWQYAALQPTPYAEAYRATLDGQLNVFIEALDSRRTRVRLSSRYALQLDDALRFVFTADTRDTQRTPQPTPGTHPARTCQSSRTAEREVLRVLESIVSR